MSLLELRGVTKRYRDGRLQRTVLSDITLDLDGGEVAVVWGVRGCGRSTLLRLAAGIEPPDAGVVRFDGEDLAGAHHEETLGAGIGYCQMPLRGERQPVLDQVMVSLLARGLSPAISASRAAAALDRAGAGHCVAMGVADLETGEAIRVALARVLALQPRLLVVDEPTKGVDLLERDGILSLLRSLADDGMAVLASTGESPALSGADRVLSLSEGELRGPPGRELAPVLALRPAAALRARA